MSTMLRILSLLILTLLLTLGCERQSTKPDNNSVNPPVFHGPYSISMSLTYFQSPPYPSDSVLAIVTIRNSDSVAVPDSMVVRWTSHGNGEWLDTMNTTYAGIATNHYRIGNGIGVDTIYATFGTDTLAVTASQLISVYDHTPRHLSLEGEQFVIAIPNDTLSYWVTVYDERWNQVRYDYPIHWSSVGRGMWLDSVTNTLVGYGSNLYRLGIGQSIDTLIATIRIDTILVSQTMPLIARTSHPEVLTLTPISHPLHFNESYSLTATVRDSYGNAILHPPLQWETSGYAIVNLLGYSNTGDTAFASLQAGTLTGNGTVSVSIQSQVRVLRLTRPFTIIPNEPASLQFTSTDLEITVSGTGSLSQTELQAQLLDEDGNPVLSPSLVRLTITNSANFGAVENRPFFVENNSNTITLLSNATGYAATQLHSGIRPGPAFIQAVYLGSIAKQSASDSIATTLTVTILQGPPAYAYVSWDRSTAQGEGGGLVSVSVSAQIQDRYSNPVQNNTAVRFVVTPDTLAFASQTSTGNIGPTGIRVPGMAFSRLTYQSYNAFDTVTVTAFADSRDTTGAPIIVQGAAREHLPLFDGHIDLQVAPMTWNFTTMGSPAQHLLVAIVTDGNGMRVARAPVRFSCQRGRIYSTVNATTPMSPPRLRTGNYPGYTDPNGNGNATVYLRVTEQQAFLEPGQLESTNQVNAYIEGYSAIPQASDTITYQRSGK
ncbi:MAG: hypothetical protein OEM52_12860 [bacterium]|nr:hypothetical protein [bacterium]